MTNEPFDAGPIPWLALGNGEPMPEELPEELKAVLRESRTRAGYCDHGQKLDQCDECSRELALV